MTPALLPCPFCGSAIGDIYAQGLGAVVTCGACQAEGPWTAGDGEAAQQKAVRLWNQRVDGGADRAVALLAIRKAWESGYLAALEDVRDGESGDPDGCHDPEGYLDEAAEALADEVTP